MTDLSNREKTRRSAQAGLPVRRTAVNILARVLREKVPLDVALDTAQMIALNQRDKALARAIIATSLRRKGQVDDLLARFMDSPLSHKKSGHVYEAILSGAVQLLFMRIPAHAAIDLAVRVVNCPALAFPPGYMFSLILLCCRFGCHLHYLLYFGQNYC